MARFDLDITYVKGEYNKVADCLSRYYENDTSTDVHEYHEYVHADRLIDPEGEDLPSDRVQEIKERRVEINAMRAMETRRNSKLKEAYEHRDEAADLLQRADEGRNIEIKEKPMAHTSPEPILEDVLGLPPAKKTILLHGGNAEEDARLLQSIKRSYNQDPLTKMVLENPENHRQSFKLKDGLIWTKNINGDHTVCVPRDKDILVGILTKAHEIVGHYGDQRTCEYV